MTSPMRLPRSARQWPPVRVRRVHLPRRMPRGLPQGLPRLPRSPVLDPWARRLIFRPEGTRHSAKITNYELQRPGALLRGWLVNADQDAALVYYGGNAEHVTRWGERFMASVAGRATYLVAYRSFGASTGEPSEAAIIADALALYDDVATRHSTVAVLGRSLGSGVAIQVAAHRDVDRVALVTPYDSLTAVALATIPSLEGVPALLRRFLPHRWVNPAAGWVADHIPLGWLFSDRFESVKYADRVTAPVLVLRSGRDTVVWPANTDRLLRHLPADTEVVTFDQADHVNLAEDPAYWEALGGFLNPAGVEQP